MMMKSLELNTANVINVVREMFVVAYEGNLF